MRQALGAGVSGGGVGVSMGASGVGAGASGATAGFGGGVTLRIGASFGGGGGATSTGAGGGGVTSCGAGGSVIATSPASGILPAIQRSNSAGETVRRDRGVDAGGGCGPAWPLVCASAPGAAHKSNPAATATGISAHRRPGRLRRARSGINRWIIGN